MPWDGRDPLSCSLQGRPSSSGTHQDYCLLGSLASPSCLGSFHVRSVSLMEPEPRGFLYFPLPTHVLIAHQPPESSTSVGVRTSWNVPPREHQRSNCPAGTGLMASESLQPEPCTPASWGPGQNVCVCVHESVRALSTCIARGLNQE